MRTANFTTAFKAVFGRDFPVTRAGKPLVAFACNAVVIHDAEYPIPKKKMTGGELNRFDSRYREMKQEMCETPENGDRILPSGERLPPPKCWQRIFPGVEAMRTFAP